MSLLDGILGGAIGVEAATLMNTFIEKQGGVQGIVSQFEKQGLGDTVKSWVAQGENQAITPDHINQVFGEDKVKELAAKLGLPPELVASKMAELLPQAVDRMTPEGKAAA